MSQEAAFIEHQVAQTLRLHYWRSLPKGYSADPSKRWPLILFLHGAGERGTNLDLVKKHGISRVLEERDLPFIVLSPQCPEDHWWSDYLPVLDDLLQDTIDHYNVDPSRVYLTGLSMGAFGTWHMAVTYPDRFAAIAPICGGNAWMYSVINRLDVIRHLPTWVFHGEKDDVVPVAASKEMVKALAACGGDVRLTTYPDAMHDSWTETYNNPELFTWFLSHSRKEK